MEEEEEVEEEEEEAEARPLRLTTARDYRAG